MTYETERRALQRVVAVAGLVPVLGGLYGVLFGQAGLGGGTFDVSTDSHFRYLSGLLLGIGLLFWSTIPGIETKSSLFRFLTMVVVLGGLARLLGLWLTECPRSPCWRPSAWNWWSRRCSACGRCGWRTGREQGCCRDAGPVARSPVGRRAGVPVSLPVGGSHSGPIIAPRRAPLYQRPKMLTHRAVEPSRIFDTKPEAWRKFENGTKGRFQRPLVSHPAPVQPGGGEQCPVETVTAGRQGLAQGGLVGIDHHVAGRIGPDIQAGPDHVAMVRHPVQRLRDRHGIAGRTRRAADRNREQAHRIQGAARRLRRSIPRPSRSSPRRRRNSAMRLAAVTHRHPTVSGGEQSSRVTTVKLHLTIVKYTCCNNFRFQHDRGTARFDCRFMI